MWLPFLRLYLHALSLVGNTNPCQQYLTKPCHVMSCHAEPYKVVINSYSKYYSQLSVRYRYRCHECQLWFGVIRHLGQSKGPIAANPAKASSAGTRVTKICVRQCPMQTDPNKREGVSTNKNYIDPPSAVFQYGLHSEPFTAHTKEPTS